MADNKEPTMMRTARYEKYWTGDVSVSDVVSIEEVKIPELQPSQVLVKVEAAAMNRADYKFLKGHIALMKSLPTFPGMDYAGSVVAVGKDVKKFQPGARVYGNTPFQSQGCFAEYLVVDTKYVSPMPENLDFVQAASIPDVGQTVVQTVGDNIAKGHKVLVIGASAGTGTFAVQYVKHLGASEVVGVCSGRNTELVESLGADRCIDYTKTNWWDELKGSRFDAIVDCVGGSHNWEHSGDILGSEGKFLTIAGDSTGPDEVLTVGLMLSIAGKLLYRKLSGLWGNPSYVLGVQEPDAECLDRITPILESGAIKAVVEKTFPFTVQGLEDMYNHMATTHTRGKIVLDMSL